MRTSIIIVNWNGLGVLKPCLAAIAENTTTEDYEVIVLDNGSTEAGLDEAVARWPKARLIRESVNHGFARGNNIAARAARGDYLVLLNNDTLPREDWLEPLIRMAEQWPRAGIVGPRLVDHDGTTNYAGSYFVASINAYAHACRGYPADAHDVTRPRECEVYVGAAMLMRRDLFESIGGFDEHYFQGYEDIDLCLRVRERGLRVLYCPDSVVEHLENVSMKKLSVRVRRSSKESNREHFERRWLGRLHEFRLDAVPSSVRDFSHYTSRDEKLLELVPDPAGAVLEVGCGAGTFGSALIARGKATRVTGLEINADAAAVARARLNDIIVGDVQTLPLDEYEQRFDTIVLAGVLEHLSDPWRTLFRLRKCLKPDGVVVASVSNVAHYRLVKKLLLRDWRYEPRGLLDAEHVRFFTRGSIDDLFVGAGFRIERVEPEGKPGALARIFGAFSTRVRDLSAVRYQVLARKLPDLGANA